MSLASTSDKGYAPLTALASQKGETKTFTTGFAVTEGFFAENSPAKPSLASFHRKKIHFNSNPIIKLNFSYTRKDKNDA